MLTIGHRGASAHALENSLTAFRLCVESTQFACDGVELDIHSTTDGELIVHHDPELADGRSIRTLYAGELSKVRLADGSEIPTLSEALEVLAPIEVFIEAKGINIAGMARLVELMHRHPFPPRLHVHSFDHRIISRLHALDPSLSLGALSASYPLDVAGPVLAAGARTLWQEWALIDAAMLEQCTAAGIGVIAWTVNNAKVAQRLRAMGVAGACGNWPERLRAERS